MATTSHQPSHQAQPTKLTADDLLAAPPPAHPASSLQDALLRPKPAKKKSPPGAKKGPKKPASRAPPSLVQEPATQTSQLAEEELNDDALVEQLLHQAAIAQDAGSAQEPHTRRSSISQKLHGLGEDLKGAAMAIGASISPPASAGLHPKRKSRQKERLARRQAAEDEARAAAQREVALNGPSVDERQLEADGIAQASKALGLQMVEMSPDGHCLFSAIADQLTQHSLPDGPHTFQSCRARAAEYMRTHPDEFIHYLPAVDDGLADGLMSNAQYEAHCDRVRDSASWGGEPEILALSKVFKFPIHVVQAGQPMMIKISDEEFGPVRNGKALMISYHRKSYGLGEHYNSLRLI